jgi:hypothetical protein
MPNIGLLYYIFGGFKYFDENPELVKYAKRKICAAFRFNLNKVKKNQDFEGKQQERYTRLNPK